MPQGTPLKDFYGRIFGYLDTKPNGDVWAYDFYGRLCGKYIASENVTKNFYGQNIAHGNIVVTLLPSIENQNK